MIVCNVGGLVVILGHMIPRGDERLMKVESSIVSIAHCMARIPNFDMEQCVPPLTAEDLSSKGLGEMTIKLHRDRAYERFRLRKGTPDPPPGGDEL